MVWWLWFLNQYHVSLQNAYLHKTNTHKPTNTYLHKMHISTKPIHINQPIHISLQNAYLHKTNTHKPKHIKSKYMNQMHIFFPKNPTRETTIGLWKIKKIYISSHLTIFTKFTLNNWWETCGELSPLEMVLLKSLGENL